MIDKDDMYYFYMQSMLAGFGILLLMTLYFCL